MKIKLTIAITSLFALNAVSGCTSTSTTSGERRPGITAPRHAATMRAAPTPATAASVASAPSDEIGSKWDKPGYVTIEEDGRLWVFEEGSEDLAKFIEDGEPAKMVVLPAAGPNRMTLKGTDRDTMLEYTLTKPGYIVMIDDGRLWVFEKGSEDLADFMEHGEPAKMVVLPAAGPKGMTLKGTDRDTMMEYALTKPGYKVMIDDGRLWVFEEGSEDLADFMEHGEPAKMVVLPAAGPKGMTLKGTDRDTMMEYALTKPGYTVFLEDGRLWVFLAGSQDLMDFHEHGEPAKIVVRPGAGPHGMTLKSVDASILDAYMAL